MSVSAREPNAQINEMKLNIQLVPENMGEPVAISSVLIAFGVSSAIGIFFGFYPAHKAAAMNLIEALRFE